MSLPDTRQEVDAHRLHGERHPAERADAVHVQGTPRRARDARPMSVIGCTVPISAFAAAIETSAGLGDERAAQRVRIDAPLAVDGKERDRRRPPSRDRGRH